MAAKTTTTPLATNTNYREMVQDALQNHKEGSASFNDIKTYIFTNFHVKRGFAGCVEQILKQMVERGEVKQTDTDEYALNKLPSSSKKSTLEVCGLRRRRRRRRRRFGRRRRSRSRRRRRRRRRRRGGRSKSRGRSRRRRRRRRSRRRRRRRRRRSRGKSGRGGRKFSRRGRRRRYRRRGRKNDPFDFDMAKYQKCNTAGTGSKAGKLEKKIKICTKAQAKGHKSKDQH